MANSKHIKVLFFLTTVTSGLVAIIAFGISYRALSNVAYSHGKNLIESWTWPLIIDGPIVAFSFAALLAMYLDRSPWLPRLLIFLATIATVAFNIVQAPGDPIGIAVAITAPVAYLLAFETMLWLIKVMVDRSIDKPVVQIKEPVVQKNEPIVHENEPKDHDLNLRQIQILEMIRDGMSQKAMANELGVSISTVKRDLKTLNGSKNGK